DPHHTLPPFPPRRSSDLAALDGHQAERTQHVRVRDLHHALRRLDEREPEPTAQALDGGRGPPGIEADRAAVGAAGIEVAEDKVRSEERRVGKVWRCGLWG